MKPKLLAGIVIIGILSAGAIFAPLLAKHDPNKIVLEDVLTGPTQKHILGTDQLGRDLFSRMLFGARVSLLVGVIAVGIAVLAGLVLGSLAGLLGGLIDKLIMRFVDIMLCFPAFFLILAVAAILEPSIFNIMLIIGLTSWMGTARLVRAEILSLKEKEFILAARAIGLSNFRIILGHLIPNPLNRVIVKPPLGVGSPIFLGSSLIFRAGGAQPPQASWGNILAESKAVLGAAWWMSVLGFN